MGLHENTIKERKPGEQILDNINDITVVCKSGWAGDNCDSCSERFAGENCDICDRGRTGPDCDACDVNFELPGDCASCLNGFAGDNCDVCGFGFSTESNCTKCIQNGLWVGRRRSTYMEVYFTFTGSSCSELKAGK